MLRSLDWRSLEQRRVDSRLSMLFKIRHHLLAIDEESYLKRGTGRREHQYRQLRADKDYTRFSFFPRTVLNTVEPTSRSYLPGRVVRHLLDSGREDRALKTQLIQRISSISLSFFIFSSFCLSQFSLFQLNLFHSFPIFSVSHSPGENPQSWGYTSISAKAKAKVTVLMSSVVISLCLLHFSSY